MRELCTQRSARRSAAPSRNDPVVKLLVDRDFAGLAALFDAAMRAAVPAAKLERVWGSVTERDGAFRAIAETRSFQVPTGEVAVSLLQFERGLASLRVTWAKDARISGLSVRPGEVEARALSVARRLFAGDSDAIYAQFSDEMKAQLAAAKFDDLARSMRAQLGASARIEDVVVEAGQLDVATVQCRGESPGFDLQVAFRKDTDRLEGLFFLPPRVRPDDALPAYADPGRYLERDVTVAGLPATLTQPKAGDPVPAVVLVHGSGPQDRDETVLANRPFRDLALGLATRGIAVLRYEKRTFGKNLETLRDPAAITLDEETVDDAVAAVQLLLGTPGVDPARVFVVGHSQGGWAAPRIAQREPRVRGLALLAASARPLEDLLLEQNRYLASIDRSNQAAANAALAELERQVARVKSQDLATAKPHELPLGVPASWWLSVRDYSPVESAKQVAKPLLVMQGDRDFQVTMTDFELWKSAIGDKPWATFVMFNGLNHLFEPGEGTPSPEEYARAGHVHASVISKLADWILALQP
jgi:uncharacterized protein